MAINDEERRLRFGPKDGFLARPGAPVSSAQRAADLSRAPVLTAPSAPAPVRAAAPAAPAASGGAVGPDGAFNALQPGISAAERGARVRRGLSNVGGDIAGRLQSVGGFIAGSAQQSADAVVTPVAEFARGLVTGNSLAPAPSAGPIERTRTLPKSGITVPNLGAAAPTERSTAAAAATGTGTGTPAAPNLVDAMANPAPNTFVSARQGVRTVGEDGSISGAPLTRGSFNVVPAAAISNPGVGNLGATFAGASQAPKLYEQQVAAAQARNAATNARAREAMIAGREHGAGDFRTTLSPEQSARVLASRQLQGQQEGAAAEIASREQIARMGEAGADRRLGQQGQQRMEELRAQQSAPQLQFDATTGKPFVFRDGALSPVAGGENFRGAPPRAQRDFAQEADDRLLSSLIKAQVDPLTGQPMENAVELATAQLAQIRGGSAAQGGQRTIIRTGILNGKRVAEYSDGSIEEVN